MSHHGVPMGDHDLVAASWGEAVPVDRTHVEGAPATQGTAVCLHGFTRSGQRLQQLAERLSRGGVSALRPTLGSLWWPRSMNNPHVVANLADALTSPAGPDGTIVGSGPTVIIGHSAGAAAGCRLAADLMQRGVTVRGLVLVDGVESPTRHVARSWPAIEHLPIRVVTAPGSPCNRHGALSTWLSERVTGRFGTLVAGSTHGDVEGDAHWVYRVAGCGVSDDTTRRHVLDLVCTHAHWLLGSGSTPERWDDRADDLAIIGRAGP